MNSSIIKTETWEDCCFVKQLRTPHSKKIPLRFEDPVDYAYVKKWSFFWVGDEKSSLKNLVVFEEGMHMESPEYLEEKNQENLQIIEGESNLAESLYSKYPFL